MGARLQWLLGLVLVLACLLAGAGRGPAAEAAEAPRGRENPRELILCGWDEVFILDLAQREGGQPKRVWSWQANAPGRPWSGQGVSFGATDECKPVDDGRKILITSSGMSVGVALVERATQKVLFWARAENAHSADLLPGDRIAVATSVHEVPDPPLNPDRLTIYDARIPGRELTHTDLPAGHGVVWDQARQLLWALADREIRAYRLAGTDREHTVLEHVLTVPLPEGSAHDLYPVPGGRLLAVTTFGACWLFDRDTKRVTRHPDLRGVGNVKSISVSPATGQLAYVQAEGDEWWAERVHLVNPEGTLHLPGERLYKARWNVQIR